MSSITMLAKSAIKQALERLREAVKTRAGDRDVEYLIEGDCYELLIRAGLLTAHPDGSAADSSAEIASLFAENADLRARLAGANAEIERLRNALHEKVVEKIAAKLAANGQNEADLRRCRHCRARLRPKIDGASDSSTRRRLLSSACATPEGKPIRKHFHIVGSIMSGAPGSAEAELGAGQRAPPAKRYGVILADPARRFAPPVPGVRRDGDRPDDDGGEPTPPFCSKFIAKGWLRERARTT